MTQSPVPGAQGALGEGGRAGDSSPGLPHPSEREEQELKACPDPAGVAVPHTWAQKGGVEQGGHEGPPGLSRGCGAGGWSCWESW